MSISNSDYQRIAFRVDASTQIGTGHFMRCLTLADELRKSGAEVSFICRDLPAHLVEMLVDQGISLLTLAVEPPAPPAGDLVHSHWLWTDQVHDAQASLQVMGDVQRDWIIVDHYALDHRWESLMRKSSNKIMVIDDLADRRHDCDILLDQNHDLDMNEGYQGKVPKQCRLLLGPRYALLREEFRELRKSTHPRDGKVRRILVFFGGVDAGNYTGLAIKALTGLELKDIAVDVVIGAQHPCRIKIEKICVELGYCCYVQTDRMAELMAAADLAIGAGGSASWERCCLGVPALLVAMADNQIEIAKGLGVFGACVYIGTKGTVSFSTIQCAIEELMGNQDRVKTISRQAFSLVDGMGVGRVCQELSY
jgi:UDP-2,4-diacetamido-2,4,6-trideoxy-beta-L-altropyranose hydrolase